MQLGMGSPQVVMCFPGVEIPEWFNIQRIGSSIHLPQGSFNHKFLGFVFCTIVGVPKYSWLYPSSYVMEMKYELLLECEGGYKTVAKEKFSIDGPKYFKSDHIFLGYNCNTCNFREFSCSTKAIIIFNCNTFPDFFTEITSKHYIKKCGVRLLFTQEFGETIKRSRCSIFDEEQEEEQEEAHSKRLKSSNFLKGESNSR